MKSIDKLTEHAKKHDSASRSTGFTVPEGYFENLQSSIMEQIPDKKPISKFTKWIPAIAAGICLMIAAVFVFQNNQTENKSLALHKVSSEESVEYLLENKEDISTEELLEIDNIDNVLDVLEKEIIEE